MLHAFALGVLGLFAVLVQQTYRRRHSGRSESMEWLVITVLYGAAVVRIFWVATSPCLPADRARSRGLCVLDARLAIA